MRARGNWPTRRRGFTLVELLVVLLIFGILTAIAVPTLISTQPQRNLAAAGDRFAQDVNYAREKARVTGNRVFIAFETGLDANQVEGYVDSSNSLVSNAWASGSYLNPGNPGVGRIARSYIVVEERPRTWVADSSVNPLFHRNVDAGRPYTYIDWLNDYDAWDSSDNDPPYPVEPMFPYDPVETFAFSSGIDPAREAFNAFAAPLVVYPQDMSTVSGSDFRARHLPVIPRWDEGNDIDQQYKVFCIADEARILAMDDGARDADGRRIVSETERPRLEEQVLDYVLLKRVELPDHCYFVNPWKNSWITGWSDSNRDGVFDASDDSVKRESMQFLQYLMVFEPTGQDKTFGGVKRGVWTYDSALSGAHGTVQTFDVLDSALMAWMVIDEVIDSEPTGGAAFDFGAAQIAGAPISGGSGTFGAKAVVLGGGLGVGNKQANTKTNQDSSGRILTFMSLGGKYYVDDYAPNDSGKGGVFSVLDYPDASRQREAAYMRNFLVPRLPENPEDS